MLHAMSSPLALTASHPPMGLNKIAWQMGQVVVAAL